MKVVIPMDPNKPMSLQIADRAFLVSTFLIILVFWAGWITGDMKTVLVFLLGSASNNLGAALGALQGNDKKPTAPPPA